MIEKATPSDDKPASHALPPEAGGEPDAPAGRVAPLADGDAVGAAEAPGTGRPLGLRVEALLFASGQPLTVARLAGALGVEGPAVQAALDDLVLAWRAREGAVELVELAGGFCF